MPTTAKPLKRLPLSLSLALLGSLLGCAGSEPATPDPVEVVLSSLPASAAPSETPAAEVVAVKEPVEVVPSASGPAPQTSSAPAMAAPQFATTAKPLSATDMAGLKVALTALAAKEAPNTKVDQDGGGSFARGDIVSLPVMLQPGQCLVVLAVGKGVSELELELYAVLPIPNGPPPMLLAKDTLTGPIAAIGAGGNCFKTPLPMALPVQLVLRASAGSGPAMLEVRH